MNLVFGQSIQLEFYNKYVEPEKKCDLKGPKRLSCVSLVCDQVYISSPPVLVAEVDGAGALVAAHVGVRLGAGRVGQVPPPAGTLGDSR